MLGALIAVVISRLLVKVLTGVFDPPPDALAIPSVYLLGLGALVLGAALIATTQALRSLRRPAIEELRDL